MSTLEASLERALDAGEISAYFQPQVDLDTGRIVAAEALCRWRSPLHGDVSPAEFIAVAEDSGLIDEIGRYMTEQGCIALAEWPVDVSVNVSPYQLRTASFSEWVAQHLEAHEGRGGALTLEITESRELDDIPGVQLRLDPLRDLGVGISLDDFGIGYSSLAQLERLRANEVKLDRSLVADESTSARALMMEAIAFAHECGMRVVAEG
ncbi:MAG TPA: EAL domain-containing protein, partial [Naasia sp.]